MRRPANSSALRLSLGVLVTMTGLSGCAASVAPPDEVTIIEIDDTGVAHRLRSAPELAALLKPALAEGAEPVTDDGSQRPIPL
jgi:hypothetical protein